MGNMPPQYDTERIAGETFIAQVDYHHEVTSTNDLAKQWSADATAGLPLLVVADRQTAGRGRGGNRWWTGPGSLAMTLLLGAPAARIESSGQSPLVALAAAVAVAETLLPLVPDHPVGIHWPNDVMIADGKVAGILVEVLSDARAIVGIGVNTNNSLVEAPEELRTTVATLRDVTGSRHDPTDLLIGLLQHLETALGLLPETPERIAERADQLCLQHGRTLTLRRGNQPPVTGRCLGIAADGALLLESDNGQNAYYSGVLLPTGGQ